MMELVKIIKNFKNHEELEEIYEALDKKAQDTAWNQTYYLTVAQQTSNPNWILPMPPPKKKQMKL